MNIEYWNWRDLECRIAGFAVFRAYNGEDLIRLDVKIREEVSSRESLEYCWDWPTFKEFYQSVEAFNRKVKKTADFRGKYFRFSSGTDLISVAFYFSRENWSLFFDFIKGIYFQFAEQREEFEQKFGKETVKDDVTKI